MNCKNHVTRQAYNRCSRCGDYICDECGIISNGEIICKSCASEIIAEKKPNTYTVKKDVNSLLLFLFSALPGLNYMYMGLVKRGIFMMAAFFGSTSIIAKLSLEIFYFIPIVIFFASFFDGFRIKSKLIRGLPVADSFEDITYSINKNKGIIIFALVALVCFDLLGNIFYGLFGGSTNQLLKVILSAGLIVFGISFFSRSSKTEDEDIADKKM